MAAQPVHLMTVDEFRQLPEPTGEYSYELHYGELVQVTRPKFKYFHLQLRLLSLLEPIVGDRGVVSIEFAFRALPESDFRIADVAYVSRERYLATSSEDNLHGAPELVIEVLSPSNTIREMYDKEQLCLERGSLEFWVVDPDRQQVRVATVTGPTTTYRTGQTIPLPLFGNQKTLAVDNLFTPGLP